VIPAEATPTLPPGPDLRRLAQRYAPQFDVCDRLLATVWALQPLQDVEEQPILTLILRRSLAGYEAVLTLCRAGLPVQAMMIGRSLFEDVVAAYWSSLPENRDVALQRLYDQADHLGLLMNDLRRKYAPQHISIEDAELSKLEERREEFERLFGTYGQRAWFGDLRSAIRDVSPLWDKLGDGSLESLHRNYAIIIKQANLVLHNTATGLLKTRPERAAIDEVDVRIALLTAFFSLDGLARLVAYRVGSDRASLTTLAKEASVAFGDLKPEQRATLDPNDPCWCGSGKKLKDCHEI
jgi:hypothetical protein